MSKVNPSRLEASRAARIRVIELVGVSALAKALELTHQAVSQWGMVPVHHIEEVERLTGFSRYELRPDVYGEPPLRRARTEGEAAA
jgi:DNA-binding transcriptional regulator YdaS (Cro superfamily)